MTHNHSITQLKRVLLLVFIVLVLACAYYYFVYAPVHTRLAAAKLEQMALDTQLMQLEAERIEIKRMQKELEAVDVVAGNIPLVADYDNFNAILDQLNIIMSTADEYQLSFQPVTADSAMVRRKIQICFACSNYNRARGILFELSRGPFRCQLNNLAMRADTRLDYGRVNVTVNITYFEWNNRYEENNVLTTAVTEI